MSLLRGSSCSYSRLLLPGGISVGNLDVASEAALFHSLEPGSHTHFSAGTCSWRSLLEGPIDRGLVNGDPDIYVVGIRADARKAPGALVQALQAQAVSDFLQTCGGKASRKALKRLKEDVRDEADSHANPAPKHGMLAAFLAPGVAVYDGPSSALSDVMGWFGAEHIKVADHFLDYLVWAGLRDDEEALGALWPEGSITLLGGDGGETKASLTNQADVRDFVKRYWAEGYSVSRAQFSLAMGYMTSRLTLQASGLRVCGLEIPEGVRNVEGGLEYRLHSRLEFVSKVEQMFFGLAADWQQAVDGQNVPEEFLEQVVAARPDGVEA